jgi:L-alanine-DL-glutamate epimerase-like enolase superfamily enzyme
VSTRIARVRVHRVDIPLLRPFVTAVRRTDRLRVVLVEVADTDGRSGWGEAPASWRVTGESPESVAAAVLGPIREAVLGHRVDEPEAWGAAAEASVVGNAAARSAVDCALWDLAAIEAGRPLAAFLGGHAGAVPTDMTLSVGTPADLLRRAREHLAEGFGTLKVKVGRHGAEGVELLRRELGPGVVLRADANQAWHVEEAVATIRRWEDTGTGLEFVEQPVAAADLEGLAAVRSRVSTPLLADEAVWNTRDLRHLLRYGAADRVNVKLAKSGGLTEALRMVALANESGVGVIIGCMMESHVGVAASAALAAAAGTAGAAQDLDAGLWLSRSPVAGGAWYDGPLVRLSPDPGLGITGLAPGPPAGETRG